MRRLQLEIAKKAPVKVMIPDEIGVGELASRMKKTGAEVVKTLMKNGRHGLPQRRHRLRHRRHHRRGDGLQGGEGGHRHHRGEAHRHRRGQAGGPGPPRPRGGGHGPRGPRQDLPAGLYPPRQRGLRRGRRHHPAHRRLSGGRERQARHLPGHPRPRGLHRHARPGRHDHRHRHPGGGRRRRHHAPDRGVHQPRQGRRDPHHRGHQQDG